MADRSEARRSAAYAALSEGGVKVLKVIEQKAGRGGSAISLDTLAELSGLCRSSVRRGVRQCETLGFVSVSLGPRHANQYRLSDGWRELDASEAARLVKQAKGPTPPRATTAPSKPLAVKKAKEPVEVEQPPVRHVPSLPRLQWLAQGL